MKKNVLFSHSLVIVAIALAVCSLSLSGCKEEQRFTELTLSNGIPVYHLATDNHVVACNIYLRGGVTLSSPEKAGLEQVLLSSMAMASKTYDRATMEEKMDDLHFSILSESSFDFAAYKLKALDKYFVDSLSVFLDTFVSPRLDAKDVEESKQQQMNSVQQQMQNPVNGFFVRLNEDSFAGHPYATLTEGNVASLTSLTLDDVTGFHGTNWVASRMFVVVVGNVDRKVLQGTLEKHLGRLAKGDYTPAIVPPVKDAIPDRAQEYVIPGMPNFHARANFVSIPKTDPNYMAAMLTGNIISDHMMTLIRTWNGLVYSPYCTGARPFKASYGSHLMIGCSDLKRVVALTRECVELVADGIARLEYRDTDGSIITDQALQTPDKLVKHTVTELLPEYKRLMTTSFYSGLNSSQGLADHLAMTNVVEGDIRKGLDFLKAIDEVTPGQITAIARQMLEVPCHWGYGSSQENLDTLSPEEIMATWRGTAPETASEK